MPKLISVSAPLIKNSKNFLSIKKVTILQSIKYLFSDITFVGWGHKKSGLWAKKMSAISNGNFLLLEDGFIRSLGLGVEGSPSFSLIQDNIGIYYDATAPSQLEELLNRYDFKKDRELMALAKEARAKIIEYKISKYNHFKEQNLDHLDDQKSKILIVAQTYGDSSLKYGLAQKFTTQEIISDAKRDNPNAQIYIKIHPDVLSGKKKSDISIEEIPSDCHILTENANPITLMGYFDKIYTKTSGMGMEALLLNKEVHCYGLPFYAGWGLTQDRLKSARRVRALEIDELFAGAYILYTDYYNPYLKKKSDIINIIKFIKKIKDKNEVSF